MGTGILPCDPVSQSIYINHEPRGHCGHKLKSSLESLARSFDDALSNQMPANAHLAVMRGARRGLKDAF